MTFLYRILGIILNAAAIFLAFVLVFSIPLLISSPLNLLSAFMLSCIVMYAWFSFKFHKLVLQQQKPVKKSLRDWIRVNGIVSLIYASVIIAGMTIFLQQPQTLVDQLKQMGIDMPLKNIMSMLVVLLVFGIVLFVHVLWTFALLKKNTTYFTE